MALRGRWSNIFRLGIKELWSLWRDPAMLFHIVGSVDEVLEHALEKPAALANAA